MGAIIANMGYLSWSEFFFKFVAPVMLTCISFAGVFIYIIDSFPDLLPIPSFLPYLIVVLGVGFTTLYPYIQFEHKKIDINKNMHYYITYMGTLSTLQITRTALFKRLSQKDNFGELSKVSKRILYLAKSWNLGYSQTCRKIAKFSPSKMYADFLDRFAAMLDFGQDISVFLIEEQKSVLDDYETEYKKSLENIKMLQEIFISMTIATGFMMAIALLMPLIMGISIEIVVRYSLLGIVVVDFFLFFMIKSLIPSDSLQHHISIKSKEYKETMKALYFTTPISLVIIVVLLWLDFLPFLIAVAIGLTPLLYAGWKGQKEEELIFKRDRAYPAFVRTLGSIIEIKEGAVTSALSSIRVHDFGTLNDMVINIYRRLRLACDKFQSWVFFAAESGSNMIYQFTLIFSESVYLGGNAEKIGILISDNFNRLLSMRRLRLQLAAGLRGAFYGSLVGFCAAAYITAKIAQTLSEMFSAPFQIAQQGGSMGGMFSSIIPPAPTVDMNLIMVYIGVMVLVHAGISAMTIKVVDGGVLAAALFDFVLMVWVGGLISWLIPGFIGKILPSAENMTTGLEELSILLLPIGYLLTKTKFEIKKRLSQ